MGDIGVLAAVLQFDDCNKMEESGRVKDASRQPKHLLSLLSRQRQQYQPLQTQTLSKMNECFSSHVKRVTRKGLPACRENRLCPPPMLTKNSNKVEQNILKHRNLESRSSPFRGQNGQKKTQLIINRPYYLQYFKPKTFEEILGRHQEAPIDESVCGQVQHKASASSLHLTSESPLRESSLGMLKPMRKTQCKGMRRSKKRSARGGSNMLASTTMGSFMDLQTVPQKQFNKEISLYCKMQLQSYYYSLLKFSKGSPQRYKEGIETMLNLMDVSSNEKVLSRELVRFQRNPSFAEFLLIYEKVVDANMRENVMDFFDIIFEECGLKELNQEQLLSLLSQRMAHPDAMEIVDEILFHHDIDVRGVTTSDIFTLCVTNDQFCIFMRKFTLNDGKKK